MSYVPSLIQPPRSPSLSKEGNPLMYFITDKFLYKIQLYSLLKSYEKFIANLWNSILVCVMRNAFNLTT